MSGKAWDAAAVPGGKPGGRPGTGAAGGPGAGRVTASDGGAGSVFHSGPRATAPGADLGGDAEPGSDLGGGADTAAEPGPGVDAGLDHGLGDGHHLGHHLGPEADALAEGRHRRALVLSEVAVEGVRGLSRVLRRAAKGDADAAAIPVAVLLRAIPELRTANPAAFLPPAHIPATALAGALSPGQRVALLELVDRAQNL